MMVLRILRAAIAGALAWWVGMQLFFGQAQALLADPNLQSAKMSAIYELAPPARIAVDPWLLPVGMFVTALFQAACFAFIRRGLPAGLVARGLAFGGVAWGLFTPWFEFYLPWSLMLEPTLLVLVEMLCWGGIMALVGLAISLAFGRDVAAREGSDGAR
jgi:hypothetical protein